MSIFKRTDSRLFFAGAYAEMGDPGIHLCELDLRSGAMRILGQTDGIANPSFLVADMEAWRLYAVSEQSEGKAVSFAIDPADGGLTKLNELPTLGADPCHLALAKAGGACLLASNYSSGNVNSFALGEDGALAGIRSNVQHEGGGVLPERQEGPHAHSAVPSRDGKYIYVSDLGIDRIAIYRLEDGKLAKHGEVRLPDGSGPRHFAIHPSERYAYGINELNNTLTVYAYDPDQGCLEPLEHVGTLPGDFRGENYPADVHLSPDGRFLYGSNRGHNSLVRFRIDPGSGKLNDPEWTGTGGNWPRNFAVLDGYVLVANQYSGNIAAFRRDAETGQLSPAGRELAIAKVACIEPLNPGAL